MNLNEIKRNYDLISSESIVTANDLHKILGPIKEERGKGYVDSPLVMVFGQREKIIKVGNLVNEVERWRLLRLLDAMLILTNLDRGKIA